MPTFQTRFSEETGSDRSQSHWYNFLAYSLFFLAAWTVVIKYLFPIVFAQSSLLHWDTWVSWDLWPIVHVWLGWAMLTRQPYVLSSALLISVTEIAIVSIKFAYFFAGPEWTIWQTNWFINKLFVLGLFLSMLITGWRRPDLFPQSFLPMGSQVEKKMRRQREKDYEEDWKQFEQYMESEPEPAFAKVTASQSDKMG